ncbi:Lsr2 family DNA-binding protein [Actinoplanes sp. G11-F43]|uniref:Lsr2 family DNA-binding protein n=1 Tax=Actinoplanes sp. G11-F43 TaxID=3424130 RepID=UPI003D338EFD
MTVTDSPARGPLSADALEAARRAAQGTPPRHGAVPMGIRYRDTAPARPSEPAPQRPAWLQALVSTPTELLEDMDPRPAKPRTRRTSGPVPAPKAPVADPANGSASAATTRPAVLVDTPTEAAPEPESVVVLTPDPEPVVAPAPVSEPALVSEVSATMPSTSAAPAEQQDPDQQDPQQQTPLAEHSTAEETIEQILARAEACPSDAVQVAAAALRDQAQRLGEALRIEAQAGGLREQIAALDAEIADRTTRRDALRAELEKLLAGDVTVSAESGPRHEPTAAEVRAWARDNGYEISDKGLIPGGVRAAYQRAQDGTR